MKRLLFLLFAGGVLCCGQAPSVFELEIPEFLGKVFNSDVVEMPLTHLSRLVIHVLSPVADDISYGKIYPKLNGNAAAVISQLRTTARGKAVFLNLNMRTDLRLLPGANTLEVTAVNARGRKYYKNWVLRTREASRNEWFAYDYSLAPNDENALPPDVVVSEPEFPIMLEPNQTGRQVRVRGSINSFSPLKSVQLNGAVSTGVTGKDTISFEQTVTVNNRTKEVSIEAIDEKGNRARLSIPVLMSNAESRPRWNGDRFALVVGISRYGASKGVPPEAFAASADAERFAATLTQTGFSQDHVLLLRDDRATTALVKNAFRNFVAQAKRDDLLVVYVAGQGLHDPASPDKLFLATYDTQMSQVDTTSLEIGELENLLSANVRSQHAVLLFDVARKITDDWRVAGSNLINAYLLKLFSQDKGRAVMVSAGVQETSRERQTATGPAGLFTAWTVEALNGGADWNKDHIVTIAELFRFVADRVRQESNGAQIPRYQIAEQSLPLGYPAGQK